MVATRTPRGVRCAVDSSSDVVLCECLPGYVLDPSSVSSCVHAEAGAKTCADFQFICDSHTQVCDLLPEPHCECALGFYVKNKGLNISVMG
jgi:hypothetical protein